MVHKVCQFSECSFVKGWISALKLPHHSIKTNKEDKVLFKWAKRDLLCICNLKELSHDF